MNLTVIIGALDSNDDFISYIDVGQVILGQDQASQPLVQGQSFTLNQDDLIYFTNTLNNEVIYFKFNQLFDNSSIVIQRQGVADDVNSPLAAYFQTGDGNKTQNYSFMPYSAPLPGSYTGSSEQSPLLSSQFFPPTIEERPMLSYMSIISLLLIIAIFVYKMTERR